MLSVENFDPNDATRAPWDTLDAQACIARLDDLRPAWQNATANRALQQERRYWLDVVLSLLDHGVMRPLQDGYLPDTATLRTERFLLGADAGPIVLAEVPALFARRLALAIETMPAPQREAAGVQWRLLQQLHGLVAESRMLDERSQVIQVLAWNPDVDLDQVEVAYILAAEYRQGMRDWLRRAALVRLPDSALRLDEVLLSSCSPLGAQADDVDYIEAMRPLHRGFMQLFSQRLSQLVLQAEQAERQAGLYPLPRATAASDEISGLAGVIVDRFQHAVTFLVRLAVQWRQLQRVIWHRGVREPIQQIADQAQPAALLVVEIHQRPWRVRRMRHLEHALTRGGVVLVLAA